MGGGGGWRCRAGGSCALGTLGCDRLHPCFDDAGWLCRTPERGSRWLVHVARPGPCDLRFRLRWICPAMGLGTCGRFGERFIPFLGHTCCDDRRHDRCFSGRCGRVRNSHILRRRHHDLGHVGALDADTLRCTWRRPLAPVGINCTDRRMCCDVRRRAAFSRYAGDVRTSDRGLAHSHAAGDLLLCAASEA